jgi:hypothetical protein
MVPGVCVDTPTRIARSTMIPIMMICFFFIVIPSFVFIWLPFYQNEVPEGSKIMTNYEKVD